VTADVVNFSMMIGGRRESAAAPQRDSSDYR